MNITSEPSKRTSAEQREREREESMDNNRWIRQTRRYIRQISGKQAANDPAHGQEIIHKHKDVRALAAGIQYLDRNGDKWQEIEATLRAHGKADRTMEGRYGERTEPEALWRQDKMVGIAYHVVRQQAGIVRALYALSHTALLLDDWIKASVEDMQIRKDNHEKEELEGQGDPLRHNHRPGELIWCAILINTARGRHGLLDIDDKNDFHMTGVMGRIMADKTVVKERLEMQLERQNKFKR